MKFFVLNTSLLLFFLFSQTACIKTVGGSGGQGLDGKFYNHDQKVAEFVKAWNGQKRTGDKIVAVKVSTAQYNHAVFKYVGRNEYFVANMNLYEVGQEIWKTYCTPLRCFYDTIPDLDLYNSYKPVTTQGRFGIYTDRNGLQYEIRNGIGKDLGLVRALSKEGKVNDLALHLRSKLGLSQKRGHHVARAIINWQRLSNERALTEKESELLSRDLFDVNFKTLKDVAVFGNKAKGYEHFIDRASYANSIRPEEIRALVNEIFDSL